MFSGGLHQMYAVLLFCKLYRLKQAHSSPFILLTY